jgi:hypothetical protein
MLGAVNEPVTSGVLESQAETPVDHPAKLIVLSRVGSESVSCAVKLTVTVSPGSKFGGSLKTGVATSVIPAVGKTTVPENVTVPEPGASMKANAPAASATVVATARNAPARILVTRNLMWSPDLWKW